MSLQAFSITGRFIRNVIPNFFLRNSFCTEIIEESEEDSVIVNRVHHNSTNDLLKLNDHNSLKDLNRQDSYSYDDVHNEIFTRKFKQNVSISSVSAESGLDQEDITQENLVEEDEGQSGVEEQTDEERQISVCGELPKFRSNLADKNWGRHSWHGTKTSKLLNCTPTRSSNSYRHSRKNSTSKSQEDAEHKIVTPALTLTQRLSDMKYYRGSKKLYIFKNIIQLNKSIEDIEVKICLNKNTVVIEVIDKNFSSQEEEEILQTESSDVEHSLNTSSDASSSEEDDDQDSVSNHVQTRNHKHLLTLPESSSSRNRSTKPQRRILTCSQPQPDWLKHSRRRSTKSSSRSRSTSRHKLESVSNDEKTTNELLEFEPPQEKLIARAEVNNFVWDFYGFSNMTKVGLVTFSIEEFDLVLWW